MPIKVSGASEHNLKDIDVEFGEGLTVVTGVSGSGKSSLVFDTVYHEAHRRFLESLGSAGLRLSPADVKEITGLGPAVAVGQNLLNRNPNSTLATASGLHPFLRLLFARFGSRHCSRCGASLSVLTEDEIVERVANLARAGRTTVIAPVMRGIRGSHRTLLGLLGREFGPDAVLADGRPLKQDELDPGQEHTIEILVGRFDRRARADGIRRAVEDSRALGANSVRAEGQAAEEMSFAPVCSRCGLWFADLEPVVFNTSCPHCRGKGCDSCGATGLHPEAASVRWQGLRLPDLLAMSVHDSRALFLDASLPSSGERLQEEIERRLEALERVGLGYLTLNRPSPTLSRGEAQRVRLALSLAGRLEDMLHVLDEPTIGQHPADVSKLLPAFRQLAGPVVYVEHDRAAAAVADAAIDLGPGAGKDGGRLLFSGTPAGLWESDTPTGRYFSLREKIAAPQAKPQAEQSLTIKGANLRNLKGIDVSIPLGRMTVITGVSGSGKSTLVEDVLIASLNARRPIGCAGIEGACARPILVDQSPIGRNPRSNPATYTKLSDIVRDIFSAATGLSPSSFSFNRPEGACPDCAGMGALEVRMRYLPSTWVRCSSCNGRRFSEGVLRARVRFDNMDLSIAEFYGLTVEEVKSLIAHAGGVSKATLQNAQSILGAMLDIGLGYLPLGQPSPSLSGGEAQRIKLVKYIGRRSLASHVLVLDEPTTGLHPQDVSGLLLILDGLAKRGATIVVVEHNTDVIRAADWVIDLGPGAGPEGGRVLYSGPPAGLPEATESFTGKALRDEALIRPKQTRSEGVRRKASAITVRGASVHNLKAIDVDFPKEALTVVTGVSGSGKSSLVSDVLEAEARKRFLESLSMYERQTIHEGPEPSVGAVSGLGVSVMIQPSRILQGRRSTVGAATELTHHLSLLLAWRGQRNCPHCGEKMARRKEFTCPKCGTTVRIPEPTHFLSTTYAGACLRCHGVGTVTVPCPDKLIIRPDRPLCDGAMYSPGFFPKGYICKPYNGGYYMLQALAQRYNFDPATTPWNKMTSQAQKAFLFGDPDPLSVDYVSRTGRTSNRRQAFRGFYGWVGDWDFGGTYTKQAKCPECGGGRIRPDYLAVTLGQYNMGQLSEMSLSELLAVLSELDKPTDQTHIASYSLRTALRRLGFLLEVGLGYLNLNRLSTSLSAGEAQRIRLAGLLGSGLRSLTVLVDEPSRGLHPSEVGALASALKELGNEGNTVIVVDHDPVLIRAADHLIDMGPGPGSAGGRIVAQGSPLQVARADTPTGRWLRGQARMEIPRTRRSPRGWMTVRGARANNLRGTDVGFPLGTLIGVCGVSGSGKSTLLIDTIGRAVAPVRQTTSVAYEPIQPGEHDGIEGAPARAVIVDQAKKGVSSPADFLGLEAQLRDLFAESEDAKALGVGDSGFGRRCSVCGGGGVIRTDMGFLPDVMETCELCRGTGYTREAWEIRLHGISLPETLSMTIDEALQLFGEPRVSRTLEVAREVGLGYLVLRQPGYALSGGEAQRLKIAKELCKPVRQETLYILDEPTVGQHLEDVARLVRVLHRLVDEGHTVIVIEHQPHLLASCDWLIELGPGGGPDGGTVIAAGRPEDLAAGATPTGPFIKDALEGRC